MLKKNDMVILEVTDLTNLGVGIAHTDSMTVFVLGAVTGDVVKAKIIKVAKSYLVAGIISFQKLSEYRTESECKASKRCGGCAFRHIRYEYELEVKRKYVESCMKKSGLDSVKVLDVLTTGITHGYRNKIQYPVGKKGIGYYANHSHEIVVCEHPCLLHDEVFNPILNIIEEFINKYTIPPYDETSGRGIIRHIFLRTASKGDNENKRVCVCIVINGQKLPNSDSLVRMLSENDNVSGIILNHNTGKTNVILGEKYTVLWGSEIITDRLCGLDFDISPASFYQINKQGAELLYNTALSKADIKKDDIIADLFCGTGTIGLIFKKHSCAKKLIGVEIEPKAVENAKKNALKNGIENAEFFCSDANDPHLSKADIIIVDPPRKGLEEKLIHRIGQISPRQVIYISCNPSTLARDIVLFEKIGYTAKEVQPVDMFPGTSHVESVVCLTRRLDVDMRR